MEDKKQELYDRTADSVRMLPEGAEPGAIVIEAGLTEEEVKSLIRDIPKSNGTKAGAKSAAMSVTLGQLLGLLGTAESPGPLSLLCTKDLPIRTSFQLSKIAGEASKEVEMYHASYKTLCERFSNKDKDGEAIILGLDNKPIVEGQPGRYDISAEKIADFSKELAELQSVEVQIPGKQIKVGELGNVSIPAAHLMLLDWLVTE